MDAYLQRATRLHTLNKWSLHGRVVVHTPEEGAQVRIHLRSSQNGESLTIRNAFGQTLIQVRNDRFGLRLRDSQGRVYHADQARRALEARLGWPVPVERLSNWVLALEAGKGVPTALDGHGRPLALQARPWEVAYQGYMKVQGVWMPQNMRLIRDQVRLRVRVDQWSLEWG